MSWQAAILILALLLAGHAVIASGHGKGRTLIEFKTLISDPSSSEFFAKIDVSGALTSNANVVKNPPVNPTGSSGDGDADDKDDDDGNNNGNNNQQGNQEDSQNNKHLKHGQGNSGNGNGNKGGHGQKGGNNGSNGGGNGNGHGSNNFLLAGYQITLAIESATFTGTADGKGRVSTPFDAKLVANGQILMIKAVGLNLVQLFPLDTSDGSHQVSVEIKVTASKTTTDSTGATTTQTLTLSDQNVTFNYSVRNGRAKGKNF